MWNSIRGWLKPAAPKAITPADAMNRCLPTCLLMLLSTSVPAAEKAEQLDADFLEYLANLEGDDDDWTLIVETAEAEATPQEDVKTLAPKTPQPADRAAVGER